MYSFKFYYLEACSNFKIKPSGKLLSRIEESANVTSLNLSTIELTEDNCKAIGHALRKDVFLQDLDLSNCMINDDGLSSILSGLESNRFLITLNLKGNNIKSAGTVVIGKFLRHNQHLQSLYLEWNGTGIFPEKFAYLCEGLSVNSSLKTLDLRNNQLNHLCAQSISDVIYRNSTLQNLDLRWNSIGLIGGRTILKSLSKNKSILKLDVVGNDVPSEIQKSIELITNVTAERFVKNSENLERSKFFASKLKDLEVEQDKQLRTLMEQLEKKDKDIETSQRWSSSKLTQLQEKIAEKDRILEDLVKKLQELQKNITLETELKNKIALEKNELEIKNKELQKEYSCLLDKDKKEKEDMERKFIEEIGIIKEENFHLKQKIQDLKITQENSDDHIIKLKNTIAKMEKMSKLQEQSFQEQMSAVNERHQESFRELDIMRKNEISRNKEEFSIIAKSLKQQVTLLEGRIKELEKQIAEKDASLTEGKIQTEKLVDELKKKMKNDEDNLRKQYEERIELLESANKKQDELLKEQLQALYEIKKKTTENDILLAEEAHHVQQLENLLKTKDAETEASIAKVRLEVKEQIEELNQIKAMYDDSLKENASLKQKIEEINGNHEAEMNKKELDAENLKKEIKKLKNKIKEISLNENKRINDLQAALNLYINSSKFITDEDMDSGDNITVNS